MSAAKLGSEQCLPLRGKQPHERVCVANWRRSLCADKRSRPLPTMQRIKGVVMARLRAGHARPLQGGVDGWWAGGAREGGSPPPFPVDGRPSGPLRPASAASSPKRGAFLRAAPEMESSR